MQKVFTLIRQVSQFHFSVLLLGESGTGKELVARAIHEFSSRRRQPFVPIDCSALVPSLAESELFGHAAGAFTGALSKRRGLLESAHGGTLFLDEIGELPVTLQPKLLRALQEREIRAVGSSERTPIDIRVIAATNRDLGGEVRAGRFRQDLYFRLNVVQIHLPPLRERKDDIPALIGIFFDRYKDLQPRVERFSDAAMAQLIEYDWPGNVRELENAVEHGIALSSGPTVEVGDLPSSVRFLPFEERNAGGVRRWCDIERWAIYEALEKSSGDRIRAARILGIGRTTLYRKLKLYARTKQGLGEAAD